MALKKMKRLFLLIFMGMIFVSFSFGKDKSVINNLNKVCKSYSQTNVLEVMRAKFGTGSDNIGVTMGKEAASEGPMSFALGKDDEIYILDQVNSRIQVFKNGKRINSIHLMRDIRFKDIALTSDSKIILLESFFKDGYEKTSIHILDSNGKTINVIPLEDRKFIPNSGEVLGIQIVNEGKFSGIWVDLGDFSVRVASLKGEAVERWIVPGKLSLNGRRVFYAKRVGDITGVIYLSEKDSISNWEPEIMVYFKTFLEGLLGIWVDQKERIYLGANLLDGQSKSSNLIVIFNAEGKELGCVKLFVQRMEHEVWQSIRVSPEGNIFQMAVDEKGVFVRKYTLKK